MRVIFMNQSPLRTICRSNPARRKGNQRTANPVCAMHAEPGLRAGTHSSAAEMPWSVNHLFMSDCNVEPAKGASWAECTVSQGAGMRPTIRSILVVAAVTFAATVSPALGQSISGVAYDRQGLVEGALARVGSPVGVAVRMF